MLLGINTLSGARVCRKDQKRLIICEKINGELLWRVLRDYVYLYAVTVCHDVSFP